MGGNRSPAPVLTVLSSDVTRPWLEFVGERYRERSGGSFRIVTPPYNELLATVLAAGGADAELDLIFVDSVWGAELAGAGLLAPLDPYAPPELGARLLPGALEPWRIGGRQWAIPWAYYVNFLYTNSEILAAGGFERPPATYEELADVSRELMARGRVPHGQVWAWADTEGLICDWVSLLVAFGGRWWDDRGAWAFNSREAVAALEFMVGRLRDGVFDPASVRLNSHLSGDETSARVFARGGAAFLSGWAYVWPFVNDPASSQVPGRVRVGLNPGARAAGTVSAACTGGGAFAIAAGSRQRDAAWEAIGLITCVASPELDAAKVRICGSAPIDLAGWSDAQLLADYPHLTVMKEQASYAHDRPKLRWYTDFSRILRAELTAALTGRKAPREALDDAVAAIGAQGTPPIEHAP